MHKYTQDYETFLSVEKGVSQHTLDAYTGDITQFLDFIGEGSISAEQILAFSTYLYDRDYTATSISRKLSAVKGFCQFLYRHNILADSPEGCIVKPKLTKRVPKILSIKEVTRLIESPSETDAYPHRDRALLEVLYGCGLRLSETLGLTCKQLTKEPFFKVKGKQGKERLVPLGRLARHSIDVYLTTERPQLVKDDDEALFVSKRGKKMSRQTMYGIIKHYVKKSGVKETTTPHTLRHTFASHLLSGDADLREVQQLLGHSSITSTQIYTHVSTDELRKTLKHCHPRH